jgi:hypothetical protein
MPAHSRGLQNLARHIPSDPDVQTPRKGVRQDGHQHPVPQATDIGDDDVL